MPKMRRAFLFSVIFILLFSLFLLLSISYLNILQKDELNFVQMRNLTRVLYTRDDIATDILDYLEISLDIESNSTHTVLNISDVLPSPYGNPSETLDSYKNFITGAYSNQTNLINSSAISVISLDTTLFQSNPVVNFLNVNSSLNLRYGYNNLSKNELILNGSNLVRNYSVNAKLNATCLNGNCANATWAGGPPNVDSSTMAMWHFDEGSGTTVADSSGNGNTGSFYGTPVWVGGRFKAGLRFMTGEEHIVVNDSSSLDMTGNLTVELWLKQLGVSSPAWLLNKANTTNYNDSNYAIWIDASNRVCGAIANGTDVQNVTSASSIQPGMWYHVAFTVDGATLKLYINGVLENSSSQLITPASNGQDLLIAARAPTSLYHFNGTIDEVAIYSRAKSADEIAADANIFHWDWGPIAINNNISAAWHFDEGSGDFGYDSSGNGNIIAFNATDARWVNGYSGYALELGTQYAVANDSQSLGITNQLTIEAWVKPYTVSPAQTWQTILHKGNNTVENYWLGLQNNEVEFMWTDASQSQHTVITSGANVQPNTWSHIAVVFNYSDAVRLYVNGSQVESASAAANLQTNEHPLIIGTALGQWNFSGVIDEVAIYSRAKTADEIYADANPIYILLDVRDALNNSVTVRGGSAGYINPGGNNTFCLKTNDNGMLNMTAGDYAGFYSLRIYANNTRANLLLKTVLEGVSDVQALLPIQLKIYNQTFGNLILKQG